MTPSFPTRRSSDLEACSYSISCVVPATAGRRQLQAVSLRHHLDGMADPFGNLAGAGRLHDLLELRSGERTRSEEHTSELQSLMRNSYAVFCLKKKKTQIQ